MAMARRPSLHSELGGSTTEDYVTPAEDMDTQSDDAPTPRNEHEAAQAFPFPSATSKPTILPIVADSTKIATNGSSVEPSPSTPRQRTVKFPVSSSTDVQAATLAATKQTSSKFMDKLRQLGPSASTSSPASRKDPKPTEGEDAADADAEESGNESSVRHRKTKHRTHAKPLAIPPVAVAPAATATATAISTGTEAAVGTQGETQEESEEQEEEQEERELSEHAAERPTRPVRRSTAPEQGLSEDEGRARLSKSPGWRRQSSAWFHNHGIGQSRNINTTDATAQDDSVISTRSRPRNFKRLSQMARGTSYGPASSDTPASPATRRADLGPRWRQVKAGFKLMSKRKEKISIDQIKSTELMAELLAGSPAALILASRFQRDEHSKRKIPVLLEQLKVNVVDSRERHESSGDRHVNFRIELEYGNGLMRKKWVIWRRLGDFVALHTKYKLEATSRKYRVVRGNETRSKLPRFPREAFPYLRQVRGLANDSDEEIDEKADAISPITPVADQTPRQPKRRLSSGFSLTRKTLGAEDHHGAEAIPSKDSYAERQRRLLETYLREMIRYQMFRAGSNRLCKFLELSALGVRLASEGGYQGKEGTLVLQSGSGIDWRRAWNPALIAKRHKPMWFLVRSSYIACVDSPEAMTIYDCFLVDPYFEMQAKRPRIRDQSTAVDMAKTATTTAAHPKHHSIKLSNSERRLKLLVKNSNLMQQWQESIDFMQSHTEWAKSHRFDSFAPIRKNVYAQWLVDGRDYMWNVSRAISQAHDVIYIHDWWLSPELYMRRPAAISQKWRLDRLLKQKAEEGVKIFVIMYRNIDAAIPIDSEYSKFSLLDLHPNIFVQRSPNQVRQNVFFWSHHEKICVVDHSIAFCGGVDLCFGRWDTPSHSLVDDKPTGFEPTEAPKDADHCQLWPGKDYSNPRVLDFFKLDDPYGEMYDRSRIPRMPWHDIGMQILGQPARDLTRHFVQRWNYILRQRTPTRPTPFLLPPSDFTEADLEAMGIDGTCEIQMLRSCGEWSMGTPGKTEHSIQNAYVKLIEESDHFVYLENQFFITSCMVEGTRINNKIGDALVERIVRAHQDGSKWLAILVIPLMPGYANAVDDQDGTSVRLIMQCQFRSICRGSTSIFGRLRSHGINPEDYIRFYSLRQWGRIGPIKALITEQLYIHAKCMVVDDRWAIIGSANINERSLLGNRDSEVAALIFDNDMIESRMAEQPYKVGRFPYTLRMRLMREHLGVDVDEIMDEERRDQLSEDHPMAEGDAELGEEAQHSLDSRRKLQDAVIAHKDEAHNFNHDADFDADQSRHLFRHKKVTTDARVTNNKKHEDDVDGYGIDHMAAPDQQATLSGRDSKLVNGYREVLVSNIDTEGKGSLAHPAASKPRSGSKTSKDDTADDALLKVKAPLPPWPTERLNTEQLGLPKLSLVPTLPNTDDTALGGPPVELPTTEAPASMSANPAFAGMRRPLVDKDCMRDPLNPQFFQSTWDTVAKNNTKLYRHVFRCQPDSEVTMWSQYHAWNDYAKRFKTAQGMAQDEGEVKGEKAKTGPPGTGVGPLEGAVRAAGEKVSSRKDSNRDQNNEDEPLNGVRPSTTETSESGDTEKQGLQAAAGVASAAFSTAVNGNVSDDKKASANGGGGSSRRRRRGNTKSRGATLSGTEPVVSKAEAESMMKLVQGHLVEWPYDWLVQEERGGKWLYTVDQMAPIEIYD